jgi:putative membrane protein
MTLHFSQYKGLVLTAAIALSAAAPVLYAQDSTDKATAAPGSTVASSDLKWMKTAAQAGIAEVDAGKLAAAQGNRDDVRSFGKMMVDEHGKANDELKAIATRKGVTLPAKADRKHIKEATKLSGLNGDKFDKEYIGNAGISDHTDAQKLFKKGASDLKDPDLKAFAQKTLPAVEHHLQMAQDMKAKKS